MLSLSEKSYAILREPSRWPMLSEEPSGIAYTGSLADAPASVPPHFGGTKVADGDGHAGFERLQVVGDDRLNYHAGDGIIAGQTMERVRPAQLAIAEEQPAGAPSSA